MYKHKRQSSTPAYTGVEDCRFNRNCSHKQITLQKGGETCGSKLQNPNSPNKGGNGYDI